MLDVKIVRKVVSILNRYVSKRVKAKELSEQKKWEKLFDTEGKFSSTIEKDLNMIFYKDSILSKCIYSGFEKDEIEFVKRYLRQGDTFLDIGSNIGLFSLYAARVVGVSGKVIAFEPTPRTFERLNENIRLNQVDSIISQNNIGLSDADGVLKMNISSNGYDAWNTFANSTDRKHDKQIEVPVKTLDNFLFEKNIDTSKIVLVKIDVEGWEVPVINGGVKLFLQDNAPVLMVEFTEENAFAAGSSCYELYDLVVSFGYKWFSYDVSTNMLMPDVKRLHYPYLNLIAIKNIEYVKKRLSS
ncbi:MAG TPA: FkbM family methyltransferase [Chitinophagaceae bacterium]|jgi:FkbM family methyltransferase|nr:FkbM family methyltransferase [Chitinophagaceae bacterium]HMU59898.1 FkbM family methyltransferase [Chitinophagaceae bacterium]